jgi:diaminopropionate ammonia-lyase
MHDAALSPAQPLAPFAAAPAPRHFANPKAWRAAGGSFPDPGPDPGVVPAAAADRAFQEIAAWPGYGPTPLVALPGLAAAAGLGALHYKDEGGRFGLGSFKALGGAYAVLRLLAQRLQAGQGSAAVDGAALRSGRYRACTRAITVTTATDGNHGRSVAWGAKQFGCRCVVYIHAEVSAGREAALRDQGAEVVRVDGNYDASVARCAADAAANGWTVVSDTSWAGYRDIPRDVMAGYSVMVTEMVEQLADTVPTAIPAAIPTHVFVQGGVGGIAGTIAELFAKQWQERRPRFLVVEPALAPCLYASAQAGRPTAVEIREETLMAGLSCGEVSLLGWDILAGGADDFLTIDESLVAPAMQLLAAAPFGDPAVVAGESAVAGLAAVLAAAQNPALKEALGLDASSRVLTIGTEGATDPEIYRQLTGGA